jgi:hypothetical protein
MRSCPKGKLMRKSYSRKSYFRKDGSRVKSSIVKASCIKDVGSKGKGKKIIKILRKGSLRKHGYAMKSPVQKRHDALRKAVKEYGKSSTIKKLNVISLYNKRSHPKTSLKAKKDMEFVRKLRI